MENILSDLRELIYKKQFWEYDKDCDKAAEVLEQIEKISSNPKLLEYVILCLKGNSIDLNKSYYYVEALPEMHKKIYPHALPKIFSNIDDADNWARKGIDKNIPASCDKELFRIAKIN